MQETIRVAIDSELQDLVPGFLHNRGRDVEKLRALLESADFEAIRLIGHSMKGAGGGYGFDGITDIGAAIEKAALSGDAPTVRQHVEALSDYLARVEVVVEE